MNTTTNKHSSVQPAAEDTTTLLAMCITEKGPCNTKKDPNSTEKDLVSGLTVVHSLAEFNSVFGTLSYDDNGQTALNIYNWLSNGGTAYVKRFPSYKHSGIVSFAGTTELNAPVLFQSKYPGAFYEDLKIRAEASYTGAKSPVRYTLTLIKDGIVVEKFYRLPLDKLEDAVAGSEFIKLGDGFADVTAGFKKLLEVTSASVSASKDLVNVVPEAPEGTKTLEDYIYEYITGKEANPSGAEANDVYTTVYEDLENKLLAPVEVVLGAGYASKTDTALLKLLEIRDDLVIILDTYKLNGKLSTPISKEYSATEPTVNDHTVILDQFFTQYDNVFTGRNIYVTQTYYLSALMPYNDNIYGIQHPIAGLRRGVLSSPTTISENLTPARKDDLFKARINYVEKTTREYAIMSQRTHDGSSEDSYTALSFLNNVRTLERMKKEIERIARGYLYEFNDSTTLSQLSNVLNKYITEWISNRTLAKGNVTVAKNAYSDEAIDVGLNIKFNGTVEVIHVDIVVD